MGPCLFHQRENRLIEFGDTTEFVIGRSVDHHLCLADSTISRKQCVIKKVPEGEWLVIDMSSFKTTLVNGLKVPPSGLYIKSGDTICLGTGDLWQLQFYHSIEDMPPATKRRRVVEKPAPAPLTELSECSQPKNAKRKPHDDIEEKYKAVLSEKDILARTVEDLKRQVKELEEAKDTADDMVVTSHLDRQELQKDYEDSCSEVDRLVKERNGLLEELKENIKKREASEALANESGPRKSSQTTSFDIEESLILKTIEVEELAEDLAEAKERLAKAEETAMQLVTLKEKVYNDAVTIIEQEFLCCVCSDLMYEPVTLNCRHTMCSDCLKEWKKKKKECPSCRTKIKTEVRPIMIDSFIDRIAPILGEEFVKKREEAKNDRAAPKSPPLPPPTPAPVASGMRGRRGRRGARGGRHVGHHRASTPVELPANLHHSVIDLTSYQTSPNRHQRRNDSDHTDEDSESLLDFMIEAQLLDSIDDLISNSDFDGIGSYSDETDSEDFEL